MPLVDDILRATLLGKKFKPYNGSSLDKKLKVSNQASIILNGTIQFIPARKPFESETKALKSKYVKLRSQPAFGSISFNTRVQPCQAGPSSPPFPNSFEPSIPVVKKIVSKANGSDVPPPMFEIFPADQVRLNWDANLRRSTAVGLHNLGNTCFLNSVLQVLTNTAPLVNYLLGDEHDTGKCPASTGFCALCLTRNHVQQLFSLSNGRAMAPNQVVNRVRCFMKSHSYGRQEDAHEFLRYFVDAMQSAALNQVKGKKLDLFTKETSVIGRIFGGYHKNEVVCNNCHFDSTTYDPFLDLSVEVKHANSLETALAHFTRAETLANENAYKCPKCKRRVSARKIFTIHQAPNVLTIQLKRFDHFGKIDRFIAYPERLNLRPYMTEKQGRPVSYKLYGVIVHHGRSTRSGHYYAFVRNPCDQWHLLDDNRAAAVSPTNALKSSGAYLLFYVRIPTPPSPIAASKSQMPTPAKSISNAIAIVASAPLESSSVAEAVVSKKDHGRNADSSTIEEKSDKKDHFENGTSSPVKEKKKKKKKKKSDREVMEPSEQSTSVAEAAVSDKDNASEDRKRHKRKRTDDYERKKAKKAKRNGSAVAVNGNGPHAESGRDIVHELETQNRLGYGGSVKSWAGTTNALDNLVVDNDGAVSDGVVGDEWNEDYDKGKVKRRKKKRGQFLCLGMNPFQSMQNAKNRREKARKMLE